MSRQTLPLTEELHQYLLDVSLREPDILRRLREETAQRPDANMQIAPEQGQFMAMLVKLIGARTTVEVGVFTGYSALCVAMALPADGRVIGCDISPKYTQLAQEYFAEAGLNDKFDLRLAPAEKTLQSLASTHTGEIDFVFIDADKVGYISYFEASLPLLRSGGLIAVDNVLWSGSVVDEDDQDEDTRAIRAFNRHVADDDRVDISLVPIADGLTLLRKR